MTVSGIKRAIDKEMEALTPAELAQYLWFEQERIAKLAATGEDVSGEFEQLRDIFNQYVLPSSIYDQAIFWTASEHEARLIWGRYWLNTHFSDLLRERDLVWRLIYEKVKTWRLGMRGRKEQEQITDLIARLKALNQTMKEFLESDMWEICNLERPDVPDHLDEILIELAQDTMEEFSHKIPAE